MNNAVSKIDSMWDSKTEQNSDVVFVSDTRNEREAIDSDIAVGGEIPARLIYFNPISKVKAVELSEI